MQLNVTDQRYVVVPLYGPPGVDLTQYTVVMAIIAEANGEPQPGDYAAAEWVTGSADVARGSAQAQQLVTANSLTAGAYMAWAKVQAGSEIPVLASGRILVGAGA